MTEQKPITFTVPRPAQSGRLWTHWNGGGATTTTAADIKAAVEQDRDLAQTVLDGLGVTDAAANARADYEMEMAYRKDLERERDEARAALDRLVNTGRARELLETTGEESIADAALRVVQERDQARKALEIEKAKHAIRVTLSRDVWKTERDQAQADERLAVANADRLDSTCTDLRETVDRLGSELAGEVDLARQARAECERLRGDLNNAYRGRDGAECDRARLRAVVDAAREYRDEPRGAQREMLYDRLCIAIAALDAHEKISESGAGADPAGGADEHAAPAAAPVPASPDSLREAMERFAEAWERMLPMSARGHDYEEGAQDVYRTCARSLRAALASAPEAGSKCHLSKDGELLQAAQGIIEWFEGHWQVPLDEAMAPLKAALAAEPELAPAEPTPESGQESGRSGPMRDCRTCGSEHTPRDFFPCNQCENGGGTYPNWYPKPDAPKPVEPKPQPASEVCVGSGDNDA